MKDLEEIDGLDRSKIRWRVLRMLLGHGFGGYILWDRNPPKRAYWVNLLAFSTYRGSK